MPKNNVLTKILVSAGVLFIWFPILTPFIFAFISLFLDGIFRFDYLMPAELFPFALLGGGLLFWAALRSQTCQRMIGWGMTSTISLLFLSQAVAVMNGLASGETEASGWPFILVMGIFVLFLIFLSGTAIGGIILLRKIFTKTIVQQSEESSPI